MVENGALLLAFLWGKDRDDKERTFMVKEWHTDCGTQISLQRKMNHIDAASEEFYALCRVSYFADSPVFNT